LNSECTVIFLVCLHGNPQPPRNCNSGIQCRIRHIRIANMSGADNRILAESIGAAVDSGVDVSQDPIPTSKNSTTTGINARGEAKTVATTDLAEPSEENATLGCADGGGCPHPPPPPGNEVGQILSETVAKGKLASEVVDQLLSGAVAKGKPLASEVVDQLLSGAVAKGKPLASGAVAKGKLASEVVDQLLSEAVAKGKPLASGAVAKGKPLASEALAKGKSLASGVVAKGKSIASEAVAKGKLASEALAKGKSLSPVDEPASEVIETKQKGAVETDTAKGKGAKRAANKTKHAADEEFLTRVEVSSKTTYGDLCVGYMNREEDGQMVVAACRMNKENTCPTVYSADRCVLLQVVGASVSTDSVKKMW